MRIMKNYYFIRLCQSLIVYFCAIKTTGGIKIASPRTGLHVVFAYLDLHLEKSFSLHGRRLAARRRYRFLINREIFFFAYCDRNRKSCTRGNKTKIINRRCKLKLISFCDQICCSISSCGWIEKIWKFRSVVSPSAQAPDSHGREGFEDVTQLPIQPTENRGESIKIIFMFQF